jgi:DNA-binding NarL/FixJ family response regulator
VAAECKGGTVTAVQRAVIRVLVADDHPPFRAGVRTTLETADLGFLIVAEASDADEAVQRTIAVEPDLALLDVRMAGSGIVAARRICEHAPSTVVVMLTASAEDEDLFAAIRAGASGYLLKDTDPDRLPQALLGVLRGEAALPRQLTARLNGEFQRRNRRHLSVGARPGGIALTSKEWEVLELLHDGLSTTAMAERLSVAPVTVRTHVAALLRKLEVRDRAEAVALVTETLDDVGADLGARPIGPA